MSTEIYYNIAFLKDFIMPMFSPANTPLRAKEENAYVFFLDFADECEGKLIVKPKMLYYNFPNTDKEVITPNGEIVVTPAHILAFFTGADKIPPLGFNQKATMVFHCEVLATASTCAMELRIPYRYTEYTQFRSSMIESLISNGGFGQI